jgi:hypothetical protein
MGNRISSRRARRPHHRTSTITRPQIEFIERRILLSTNLVGSRNERPHSFLPDHSFPGPARVATPNAVRSAHPARAKLARTESAFVVPGAANEVVDATFTLSKRQASYRNEVGIFVVDDATGRIGSLEPGDHGYAAAALARRQRLFSRNDRPGTNTHIDLKGGSFVGTYLIQNSSAERFLARNRQDRLGTSPLAFFSFSAANPDQFQHLRKPTANTVAWEDLTFGGDRDFNDAVVTFSFVEPPPPPPTGGNNNEPIKVTLQLDPSTDSAPLDDNQTAFATVILVGETDANLPVTLLETGATTTSDSSGRFEFDGVNLTLGANTFDVQAVSGNRTGTAKQTFTRVPVPPPAIAAALAHDTAPNGQTNTDGVTFDPTIAGTITDSSPIASFRAGFDATQVSGFRDVKTDLTAADSFQFTLSRLNQVFGATLPDGPHTLHLQSTDTAGNDSAIFNITFTLDTQAPVPVIQQPVSGLITNHNPAITGTVTDATSSVVQLQAQGDGAAYADEALGVAGTFTFTASVADGAHTVNVKAQDLAGNISSPVSTSFTLDATPPTIVITNPTATVTSNVNITIEGHVADDLTGVASLTAAVDGSAAVPVTFDSSGQFQFSTPLALDGTTDGPHTVTFLALDNATNPSAPAIVTFTLDATKPVVVITSPADGSTTNMNVTVIGKVTDNLSGVASLAAQLDNGAFTSVSFDGAGNYTYLTTLPGDGSADGQHVVRLQATDAAGNISPIAHVSFMLDTIPPAVSFDLDPSTDSSPVGDQQTTFTTVVIVGQTEPNLPVTLVETGAMTPADSNGRFTFTGVPLPVQGANAFHVHVTDAAGNMGSATKTFTLLQPGCVFNDLTGWTIDEQGGSTSGHGTAEVEGDHVVLSEGDSFHVALEHTFVIPAGATSLTFTYDNLAFDTTDPSAIKDAFEASLLDSSGHSLVNTIGAGRDAYFNITEGETPALGSGATLTGTTVTLDLAGVFAGTSATLVIRLVNNDSDHGTSVAITCVQCTTGAGGVIPLVASKAISPFATDGDIVSSAPTLGPATSALPALAAAGVGIATLASSESSNSLQAQSSSITVEVGYADNLRPSPFFPDPWQGSPNSTFVGTLQGGIDSGAIRIINNAGSPITVNDVTVTLPGGQVFDLWGSNVVPAGANLILTQTSPSENFDTSDFGTLSFPQTYPDGDASHAAQIDITVNGTVLPTFLDTGHVLTTGGSDLAAGGSNESLNWRLIGTTGVGNPGGEQPYVVHVSATTTGSQLQSGTETLISGNAESIRIDNAASRPIAVVTINGVPVETVDASGNFFAKLSVGPGQNSFNIVATDVQGTTGSTSVTLQGVQLQRGPIDFTNLSNVSASFTGDYARTSYAESTHVLYADLRVRNAGQYIADAPVIVGVKNISDPSVRATDFDGVLPDGTPYYNFTPQMLGKTLAPGATTDYQSLAFSDSNRVHFTYDLEFLGQLNRAPVFTSVPVVDALVSKKYTYQATAIDADKDNLTYSLTVAPTGMTVDANSGKITWSVTSDDLGTQGVTLRVDDGRGGVTTQKYVISVTDPPPDRPPNFTSVPIVDANVNVAYAYTATAFDPDGDALEFSVARGPAGLQIDAETGLVSWAPLPQDVGTQAVSLTVADGRGGTATQSFSVVVQQEPGNHPPVIVSTPVTTAFVIPAQPFTVPSGYQAAVLHSFPSGTSVSGLAASNDGTLYIGTLNTIYQLKLSDHSFSAFMNSGLSSSGRMVVADGVGEFGSDLLHADWNFDGGSCCNGTVYETNRETGASTVLLRGALNRSLGDPFGVAIGPGNGFGSDLYVMDFQGASPQPPLLERITADAHASIFAESPLWTNGSLPADIVFSPGGDYGDYL